MPAATAGQGASAGLDSSTDVEMTDGFPGSSSNGSTQKPKSRVHRAAHGTLSSLPARPGNVDVSPRGLVAVATKSVVHVLNWAIDTALPDKPSMSLKCHRDPERDLLMHHSRINAADIDKVASARGKAYSGMPGYTDYSKADDAILYAKWAPVDIGPSNSPVLAVLTAKRNLALYVAKDSFVTGQWTQQLVLDHCAQEGGGIVEPIASFTWAQHEIWPRALWLIGGSLHGTAYVWCIRSNIEADKCLEADLQYEKKLFDSCIYLCSLQHPSDGRKLALCARGRIRIYWFGLTRDAEIDLLPWGAEVSIPGHITMAVSDHKHFLCCTPGSLYFIESHSKKHAVVKKVLKSSAKRHEIRACQPVTSANETGTRNEASGSFVLTLQDGTLYMATEDSRDTEISSCGYFEPPNDEIAAEQRQVEQARGLYALVDRGCGLVYMCHDANDVAAWTYLRAPKTSFSVGLSFGEKDTEKGFATRVLSSILAMRDAELYDGTLNKISRLRHTLVVLVEQSDRAERLLDHIAQTIRKHCEVDDLDAGEASTISALQLCHWLTRQNGRKDRKGGQQRSVPLKNLEDLRMQSTLRELATRRTDDIAASAKRDEQATATQLKILMAAARAMDKKVLEGPYESQGDEATQAVQKLADGLLGPTRTAQLQRTVRGNASRDNGRGIETGEECRICRSAIYFDDGDVSKSTCSGTGKHEWNRCATTFAIMTRPRVHKCIICGRETIHHGDAEGVLQRVLLLGNGSEADTGSDGDVDTQDLDPLERCGVCCGAWITLS